MQPTYFVQGPNGPEPRYDTAQCILPQGYLGHQAQQNAYNEPSRHRRMTVTDLGIIDQLLDEKVGMDA